MLRLAATVLILFCQLVLTKSQGDKEALQPVVLFAVCTGRSFMLQVLLSDKSGFLPAAHSAQGDVLQDNSQGLTCWQVGNTAAAG